MIIEFKIVEKEKKMYTFIKFKIAGKEKEFYTFSYIYDRILV